MNAIWGLCRCNFWFEAEEWTSKGLLAGKRQLDGAAQLDFMELLFFTLSLENVPSARWKTAETDRLKPKLNIMTMLRLAHSTQWQPKWQPMKIVVESDSMIYWHRWLHDAFTAVTKGRTWTAVEWMHTRFCKKHKNLWDLRSLAQKMQKPSRTQVCSRFRFWNRLCKSSISAAWRACLTWLSSAWDLWQLWLYCLLPDPQPLVAFS